MNLRIRHKWEPLFSYSIVARGIKPHDDKTTYQDLVEKGFKARDETAFFIIPRKLSVEAVAQSFLLPADRLSL
jgi:hypothetical protein